MSGKKFVAVFLFLIVISAIGLVAWIKQGYDSRPAAKVEADIISTSCAAATATVNQFIEFDRAGKTMARSADVDALLNLGAKDVPAWDTIDLTRESVVAGCRDVGPEEVEVVVSHAVYGSLAAGFAKEEFEKVLKSEPKQMQNRVTVINHQGVWKIDPSTVYVPHISVDVARTQAH